MNFYKSVFLVLFLSFSFSKDDISVSNKPVDSINIPQEELNDWDNQIKDAKNPELRKALEKLKEEYLSNRKVINKDYRSKIEPYKNQRKNDMKFLKKEFDVKKESLIKKYGVNPRKIKKSKKSENQHKVNKTKKPEVFKPVGKDKIKSHVEKHKINTPAKKPILKESDNSSSDKK